MEDLDAPPTSVQELRESWQHYQRSQLWTKGGQVVCAVLMLLSILASFHSVWFWAPWTAHFCLGLANSRRAKAWDRFVGTDMERTRRMLRRHRRWDLLASFNQEFPPD